MSQLWSCHGFKSRIGWMIWIQDSGGGGSTEHHSTPPPPPTNLCRAFSVISYQPPKNYVALQHDSGLFCGPLQKMIAHPCSKTCVGFLTGLTADSTLPPQFSLVLLHHFRKLSGQSKAPYPYFAEDLNKLLTRFTADHICIELLRVIHVGHGSALIRRTATPMFPRAATVCPADYLLQ